MGKFEEQYRNSDKLMARAQLHQKYGPPGRPPSLVTTGRITAGAKVLDIGCGPGRFWAMHAGLLPSGIALTLADMSPGMVDEAVANVGTAEARLAALEGKVADVCALPFADASFDVVTAMYMLYHARDRDLAVREIARVLRPGGVLLATTNGRDAMQEMHEVAHQILGAHNHEFGAAPFSLESGEPFLRAHFDEVEVRRFEDVLDVTDAEDIVRYVTSYPPGDTAPPDTIDLLRAAFVSRITAGGGAFRITRITGHMIAGLPRSR